MKKIIKNVFCLSVLALLASCGGGNQGNQSSEKPDSTPESSEHESESSINAGVSSVTETSSINTGTSSKANISSSHANNNSSKTYVDNQLSAGGLVINFNATGASISAIKWNNTQIAKDGFTVGRCANRLANGKFTIDGVEYTADINSSPHSLHGGNGSGWNSWRGPFATADWTKVEQTASSITYSIHSNDKANGYPGNMDMTVKYSLSQEGALSIEYSATTDKATLCNPTNHLFMDLNGNRSYDNVKLQINADKYTPLENQIPTGEIVSVENTQFDYRVEKAFDSTKSYDDNLVLNGTGYRKVATMTGSTLGVKVDVFTDRPGLQLYKDGSGNICLETQMFPDMINHPEFADYGTTILRPGETFASKTTYAFSQA